MAQCGICGKQIGIKGKSYVDGVKACYECWVKSMKTEVSNDSISSSEGNIEPEAIVAPETTVTEEVNSIEETSNNRASQTESNSMAWFKPVIITIAVVIGLAIMLISLNATSDEEIIRRRAQTNVDLINKENPYVKCKVGEIVIEDNGNKAHYTIRMQRFDESWEEGAYVHLVKEDGKWVPDR